MNRSTNFSRLKEKVEKIVDRSAPDRKILEEVAGLLHEGVDYYDWVGFYIARPSEEELVLGPYVGEETEHTKIAYGEGICGQSAETEDTFTVQNVEKADNYLSCSPEVKSEIVVPVFQSGEFKGEIDIDSHEFAPFGPEDESFLETIAEDLAPHF